jgi:A/G-specific adenine glycosylase
VDAEQIGAVQQRLLDWYGKHGRDLPWRKTSDPYAILVSEVMLQQTQVERVIPKWRAWLQQFPTLTDLARASRADTIRAWQGLGYNLRAVRLHAIAMQVVAEHDGQLPRTLDGLRRLKGIGRYTAGAVACFAYGVPAAAVDTNVRRVLGRVFGVPREAVEAVADTVLPADHAYIWNQALMDLGATICRVERPLCLVCPLLEVCAAPGGSARRKRSSAAGVPFAGSSRYYRGRILDVLRTLPDGGAVSLDDLARVVVATPERVRPLLERMISDGLISRIADAYALRT